MAGAYACVSAGKFLVMLAAEEAPSLAVIEDLCRCVPTCLRATLINPRSESWVTSARKAMTMDNGSSSIASIGNGGLQPSFVKKIMIARDDAHDGDFL